MKGNKAFSIFRKGLPVAYFPLDHVCVVILTEHGLYWPDKQHVQSEDRYCQKDNLMKKPPHVRNQPVGIANIDESAENDPKVRNAHHGVEGNPAGCVILAESWDVIWILVIFVKVCMTNFEKNVNIYVVVYHVDKEVDCQEKVNEVNPLSLFDKSPEYEGL